MDVSNSMIFPSGKNDMRNPIQRNYVLIQSPPEPPQEHCPFTKFKKVKTLRYSFHSTPAIIADLD